jgi:hypothetical protein
MGTETRTRLVDVLGRRPDAIRLSRDVGQTYHYKSSDLLNRGGDSRMGHGTGSDEPSKRLIRPSFCRVEMVYGTKESLVKLSGWIREDG